MEFILKKLSIISIFIILVIFVLIKFYYKIIYVDLELVQFVNSKYISFNKNITEFDSELHWVCIDSTDDEFIEKFKFLGIDFKDLDIDFNKNNIVLSFSREIRYMKFRNKDFINILFGDKYKYPVTTKMSKDYTSNNIYIYKIPKYYIAEDDKSKIIIE